jgi:hypothetical protein
MVSEKFERCLLSFLPSNYFALRIGKIQQLQAFATTTVRV